MGVIANTINNLNTHKLNANALTLKTNSSLLQNNLEQLDCQNVAALTLSSFALSSSVELQSKSFSLMNSNLIVPMAIIIGS